MNPTAIPSALMVLPRPSIDGHELRLERRPDPKAGSLFMGCSCRPGYWRSIARDGLPDTWKAFKHHIEDRETTP